LPIYILFLYAAGSAATWTVTSTADSGPGTLRSAIDSANASAADRDTIAFDIAGPGPHTIVTSTAPPPITKSHVLVDGYTQAGAVANTLAEGDNAIIKIILRHAISATSWGLVLGADSCEVRGLAITNYYGGIYVASATVGNVAGGNFIGVDAAGTACVENNYFGILVQAASETRIGGMSPADRNILSCNGYGIFLGDTSESIVVQGNYIGTDKNGTAALGNTFAGIWGNNTDSNIVGGTVPGSRNVISGNVVGIHVETGSTGNLIEGNFIGTDRSGTVALGNTGGGIEIYDSPGNAIGGASSAAANVISCNGDWGIVLNGAVRTTIVGNLIGTDVTGLIALGSQSFGIMLTNADSNSIGQAGALRNVICGMGADAIFVSTGSDVNTVTDNYIGVGSDGSTAMGSQRGVDVFNSSDNIIGEPGPFMTGNVIANCTFDAITIFGTSVNNTILANSIRDNAELGIDIIPDGVTANDLGDGDTGPNDLQNYPVLTAAKMTGSGTRVLGSLNSAASTSYYIQVFASPSCDPSGYGEGRAVVDTFTVTTNSSGDASISHNMVEDVGDTVVLTATATNPAGSTSEFSNCVAVLDGAVGDTLAFFLFSPVNMVVTDPLGDSIGIDSASGVVFNTILNGSTYDTTTDLNSSDLTGPDGSTDDIVTISSPISGDYVVRLYREDGAADTMTFTAGIRINGNQMVTPDDYFDTPVSALGNTVSNTFVWTAATTLPGDCNADGNTTSADIIYLVNYVFKGGAGPVVAGHGDVNCDGATTSADIIYLVNYVFKGGLSPCSHTAG
jgi:hypothetical protein